MPRDTIQIPVHPTKPEANREVTVFQVENIPGVRNKKAFYHGYFIALPIDWRWYLDDDKTEHVKARVFTDNSVMLTMPAFDYTLLHDRDTITMTNTEAKWGTFKMEWIMHDIILPRIKAVACINTCYLSFQPTKH